MLYEEEKNIFVNQPSTTIARSPLLAAALDRFVTENLENWVRDVLTLADLGESSGAELVRHFWS